MITTKIAAKSALCDRELITQIKLGVDPTLRWVLYERYKPLIHKHWHKLRRAYPSLPSAGGTQMALPDGKKILAQIEYYFGDKNYPTDTFLQKLSDPDGWVPHPS